ncbi:hypothetical protein WNZ15_10470 [Roseibium sp. AS2]|uniref:hypothetical protein n=1 Tax=Roseibium sp. AS2 TaxID=3135781 RepID=UPI0031789744
MAAEFAQYNENVAAADATPAEAAGPFCIRGGERVFRRHAGKPRRVGNCKLDAKSRGLLAAGAARKNHFLERMLSVAANTGMKMSFTGLLLKFTI